MLQKVKQKYLNLILLKLFKHNKYSVLGSYVIALQISENRTPFMDGQFFKNCLYKVAHILCFDKTSENKKNVMLENTCYL